MLSLRIEPKKFGDLRAQSNPASTKLPETLPDVLYDTQSYLAAGVNQLSFFTAVNADTTLCNLEAAGMLPAPQYFEIHRIFVDFLQQGIATTLADSQIFFKTCRPTFTFTMKAKQWGPIPVSYIGGSGGEDIYSTVAAAGTFTYGRNGDNGGFPVNGAIIIPPNTQFRVTLNFNATAITTATNILVSFLGVRHRLVA